MPLPLYCDHNIHGKVVKGLRRRGFDVLTCQDDDTHRAADADVLERATQLGRVLYSYDDDLLVEARRRQDAGLYFVGVIHVHSEKLPVGQEIQELELILAAGELSDVENRVTYLPL